MTSNPKFFALCTKNEIDWLISRKKFSKGYERKIKSDIRKKINLFYNYEVPLLLNRGFDVTKYCNTVSANCNTVSANCNTCSDDGIDSADIVKLNLNFFMKRYNDNEFQSLGRDLIPRPFPYQGNALPG